MSIEVINIYDIHMYIRTQKIGKNKYSVKNFYLIMTTLLEANKNYKRVCALVYRIAEQVYQLS